MIKILYFASLRETLDTGAEELKLDDSTVNVATLKQQLGRRGDSWQQALDNKQSVLVSVNQEMADDETPIKTGDEVAFFPPVTGG